MANEFYGDTGVRVKLLFEVENAKRFGKATAHEIYAPGAPGPELRANVVDVSNAAGAQRTYPRRLHRRKAKAEWVACAAVDTVSRSPAAQAARRCGEFRSECAAPAPCTGAGKDESKCRVAREAPGAHLARATGPCERRGCGRRTESCLGDAR